MGTSYSKTRHTVNHHRYHIVWIAKYRYAVLTYEIKKRYWGRHFWARGYFSATSGNVTDEIINEYIDRHADAKGSENINNIQLE